MSDIATRGTRPSRRRTSKSSPTKDKDADKDHEKRLPAADDRTELELQLLDEAEFAQEMERRLGLGRASYQEEKAMEEVLLPRPKNKVEEEALHARVMDSLRERVLALEKEDDPEFDPFCPGEPDLTGLADDPLQRLSSLAGQQTALRTSATQMPEKL
ncbi:hypothetical protein CALVIDRAFT_567143 [Calocera viscosa TUFC12733]|uniref:Uncharacterized protein n=1 Tax=Calocera viscosa (strain TUFC12733) TaxID=1330018 RepID=A0A167IHN4_CALVF|nr:hypothetical protein CALVIDRAFT_567143 [Calocera viscosa TUFC12733]